MLNKKGTSIMELIISIALLSIILAFMLKLLVDLNNSSTNTNFAKDNQIIRSEIIRTIENDIKNKELRSVTKLTSGCNAELCIQLQFTSGTSIIYLNKNEITYKKADSSGTIRSWTMDGCTVYTKKVYINRYAPNGITSYGFILNIQIHTSNNENNTVRNNPLDDIQISYFNNEYPTGFNIAGIADIIE